MSGFRLTATPPAVMRLGVIAALFLLWEFWARLFGDPLFICPPSQAVAVLSELFANQKVVTAIAVTCLELVIAFGLSVAVGLAIGLVVGLQGFIRGSIYPVVLLLYAIPQATVLPLVILIFGIGPAAKIAFGVSHGIFPIILSVVAGVQNIKPIFLTSARSMGASRRQILLSIIVPHMIPSFFTGMRLAMSAVLLGVLLAELYVSTSGVGYYTRLFTDSFEPPKLFALVAILAAIAVTLNELCRWAERRFSRWHA
jgi:ABC-type nitrate/sulfonate/bicarbonate transport system permease component